MGCRFTLLFSPISCQQIADLVSSLLPLVPVPPHYSLRDESFRAADLKRLCSDGHLKEGTKTAAIPTRQGLYVAGERRKKTALFDGAFGSFAVNYLTHSTAGISVYGFVLDRFFVHTSFGALCTTTWFILGRSLGAA